ncbi:MAG: putative ribosome biogenesis GTPase RsgA [Spirochaetes bacterium ADurb.Bin218]|jgi:ribosome biogenesis GTPase|nr:MAG: putative ribosome biogenesis GTPase RsgA [Spirochaetes bacterium ADurb.Bin218]HOQ12068.1 ribosome small subunit-dependent GTPase A [Spirochaetota bacterium]HOV08551.1 ribosome small subunit-dependent GTPase A [Spirochaetota bacterium]
MTGHVIRVFGKFYTVFYDEGIVDCVLRGKLKILSEDNYSNPVAVGDIVDFEVDSNGHGLIKNVHPRENVFTRKDGVRSREDLIACNLDKIIVVQSFGIPKLNLRFSDRIVVRAGKGGVPVALVVNKSDMASDDDFEYVKEYYKGSGVDVFFVSALTGDGLSNLKELISKKRNLLVGYSGVGKSSLLNKLYPALDLRTSEVSESTGKGRHTTTNVHLVRLPDGTEIIDTPGVREFGLVDVDPYTLGNYFMDFKKASLKCKFRPCSHEHEPGCEVKRLVDKGKIHEERYISYLNILYSIKENLKNMY